MYLELTRCFSLSFRVGAEEILEGAPLVAIKIVHEIHQMRLVEAVIAEELAHVRPVFLFDVSAIVFVVGTGTGELSGGRPVGQIPVQMVIQEFGTIIAIKAEHGKRQPGFNILDLRRHAECTFIPGGAILGPAGQDIGHGQTPDEITGQRVAAVGHRIGFHEAWLGDIPMLGANASLVFEQGARLGAAQLWVDWARTGRISRSILRALMASSCILAETDSAPTPARSGAATAK